MASLAVAVINPLASSAPTGMGIAGDAVAALLRDLGADRTPPWVGRWFRFINDRLPLGALRMAARLLAVQLVPLLIPRGVLLIFTAHQAPLWRTGRHVVIVHDLIAAAFPFQHRLQTLFFVGLLPRVIAAAEHLVTISQATKDALAAHLPADRVRAASVIPSYSERVAPRPPAREPRRAQRFLFVGAKYRHKNLGLVLAAFQLLRTVGVTDAELVVLGCDRDLWRAQDGGLAPLERAGWLTCVPYAQDDLLRREYDQCTALIYPSLAEGLGLPPLEAMSAGCPVICADIPALRETCAEAAWYVDPHDPEKLAALLRDWMQGRLREELARQQAAVPGVLARFSRERIAGQWQAFLTACASR